MFKRHLNDCAPELSIPHMKSINITITISISPLLFGSYLAGLIEGDGTIIVPKKQRYTSPKGKMNYASIQIIFNVKDFPLCQFIQKQIGHGTISKKKQSAAYILTINNLVGLIVVSDLINGKMRGPKYHQFELLVEYLTTKSKTLTIKPMGINTSSLLSDSWLSGFIEANGSFKVRTSLNSKYPRISLSFELVQACMKRRTHNGFTMVNIMQYIAIFLAVNLNEIRSEYKNPQYKLRTSSLRTNQNIRDYLVKHPLKGTKYLDFIDWCKVLYYFKERTHKVNIAHIVEIKSQMNQRRTVYNWDHLQ